MIRSGLMAVCVALAGCSRERPDGNEVDLNRAAAQAQDDIANYAASRHASLRRSVDRRGVVPH